MAIIENAKYNSLPEQVEENKENIKRINEILENIDPEEVATILSDIQALKAEQVVQNTAIGSNTQNINDEKTARESVVGVNVVGNTYLKTATPNKQILINNDGIISLTSSNFVEALANNFVRIATDNASVKADENNGVIIEVDSDNPKTLTLKPNGDFEVSNGHILKFDTTGAITIDGQPIGGGGGQLYRHCITITQSTPSTLIQMSFDIISSSNLAIDTKEKIATYLNNNLLNDNTSCLGISGFYRDSGNTMYWAVGIFADNNTDPKIRVYSNTTVTYDIQIPSATVSDNVITL